MMANSILICLNFGALRLLNKEDYMFPGTKKEIAYNCYSGI
jgi:hypothetical protein